MPIGKASWPAVMHLNDGFGCHCHLVYRPMSEINDLFRMSKRECGAGALVAGVSGSSGVSVVNPAKQSADVDGAYPIVPAYAEELPVPVASGR